MYKGFKIIINTAAGRRRYMQHLVPIILSCDIIDRYDIWVNTYNGADIAFFKKLAEEFPKVNLVWQPDRIVDGIKSINAFYRNCIDEDAIYFKIDDDLLWIEPGGIKKMVDFRIDHPEYFLVSPIVINNSLSTYLLQMRGKIELDKYYNSSANHPILWESPEFAAQLHEWFIDNYLSTNKWSGLHCGSQPMGMNRFSINAVLWFGKDLNNIHGEILGDDEEFLSSKYPTIIGKANCWNADVISVHFAFYTQRACLDSRNILKRYSDILSNIAINSELRPIYDKVQTILKSIDTDAKKLEPICHPYVKPIKKSASYPTLLRSTTHKFSQIIKSIYNKYCSPKTVKYIK